MLNKRKKILGLVVLATTLVGSVPAFASDFKEYSGELTSAVSYKNKIKVIDGNVQGKDYGVYYFNGSSYKNLSDVDTNGNNKIYGNKYLQVADDSYIDLSTGKVTDDEIASNDLDNAKTSLRKALKKSNDSRYNKTVENSDTSLNQIVSNKFLDSWYEGTLASESKSKRDNGGSSTYEVYTDTSGNYIDADYLVGKVQASTTDASITVKNTSDDYNGIRTSVSNSKVLGSDSSYIYRETFINFTTNDGEKDITSDMKFSKDKVSLKDRDGNVYKSIPVIQKISKASGSDNKGGAKLPKTVDTYFLVDKNCDPIDITGCYTIVNGRIVVYSKGDNKVNAKVLNPATRNGFNYFDVDSADLSINSSSDCNTDTDKDGNLWVISKGRIYLYNNKDSINSKYKVDGSENMLSVYDSDNIISWSNSEESYSVLGGASTSTTITDQETSNNTDTDVKSTGTTDSATTTNVTNNGGNIISGVISPTGWIQDEKGNWKFRGETSNGWILSKDKWYYVDATGYMQTGWILSGNYWYYLNVDGSMVKGWVQHNGKWYFLNESGAMQTGWNQINGSWYYMYSTGDMASNTTIDGYKVGPNGAWIR